MCKYKSITFSVTSLSDKCPNDPHCLGFVILEEVGICGILKELMPIVTPTMKIKTNHIL
jgi:hypothetical protein